MALIVKHKLKMNKIKLNWMFVCWAAIIKHRLFGGTMTDSFHAKHHWKTTLKRIYHMKDFIHKKMWPKTKTKTKKFENIPIAFVKLRFGKWPRPNNEQPARHSRFATLSLFDSVWILDDPIIPQNAHKIVSMLSETHETRSTNIRNHACFHFLYERSHNRT